MKTKVPSRKGNESVNSILKKISKDFDWSNSSWRRHRSATFHSIIRAKAFVILLTMASDGQTRFFYKDSLQNLQGPFSIDEMRAWFSAGFLPEDLCVRPESESEFVSIKDRAASGKPFAFTVPAEPASATTASEEPKSKKAKSSGREQSPEAATEATEDEVQAPLTDLDRNWLYKDKTGLVIIIL
jgi:hypothetical protein